MMPDDSAACYGEWPLFDRRDPVGIAEQINMCRTCPVINACLKLALDTPGRTGTWAGRYFGDDSQKRTESAACDAQLLDATETELKAFHRDYYHGAHDPLTLAGERAYSRLQYVKRAAKIQEKEVA